MVLHVAHVIEAALDFVTEARLAQINLSAVFDFVSHATIIYKLKSGGLEGYVLSVTEELLTCRSHSVSLPGCRSQSVGVVSGVPQGSVLSPLHFILFTTELMRIAENIFVSYTVDSTLMAVRNRPADRAGVTESLNRDLVRIGDWRSTYRMLLNHSKIKSILFSRSRTSYPPFLLLLFFKVRINNGGKGAKLYTSHGPLQCTPAD